MKIRLDYVTNSSSVSYGVATIQALEQLILLGGLFGLSSIFDGAGPGHGGSVRPTKANGAPDRDIDWDEFLYSNTDYDDKLNKIEQELLNFQAEWENIKDGIAAEDFEQVKSDYEAYFDYLEGLKDACDDIEDEKALEEAMNEYNAQYEEDWGNHRKDDIVNVKNDIAELQATIAGYQANGLDTGELEAELAFLQGYEKDLEQMLQDAEIDFTYTAEKMDPIDPPPELIAIQLAHEQKMQDLLAQAQANEERKAEIRAEMIKNAQELQKELENAGFWEKAEFIAQVISGASDMAIDMLAYLTGPAGQIVKIKYNIAKNIGETATDVAWDPDNAAGHLLKGSTKITFDMLKENLPDGGSKKYYEFAIDLSTNLSSATIDELNKHPKNETAEQFSERLQKAAFMSTVKTGVNTGISELSDRWVPKAERGDYYELDTWNVKNVDKAARSGLFTMDQGLDEAASNAAQSHLTGQISKLGQDTVDKTNETYEKISKMNAADKGAKK